MFYKFYQKYNVMQKKKKNEKEKLSGAKEDTMCGLGLLIFLTSRVAYNS